MTCIYEAEITRKAKQQNENQLTSRVFGALAMLDNERVLLPFLKLLATDVPLGQDSNDPVLAEIVSWESTSVRSSKILLWRYVGIRCPDVYIATPIPIVIEVKQNIKPRAGQLIPQYQEAHKEAFEMKENKGLAYFLLTKDLQEPPEVKRAEGELRREFPDAKIHWRSWLNVPKWLKVIANAPDLDEVSKTLIEATIKLLEDFEMMREPHIKKEWFDKSISKSLEEVEELTKEIRLIYRRVSAKIKEYDLEELDQEPSSKKRAWFNYADEKPDHDWIPKFFEFYYKPKRWKYKHKRGKEEEEASRGPDLYIVFDLTARWEGIRVGLWWDKAQKEHFDEIEGRLKENPNIKIKLDYESYDKEEALHIYEQIELDGLADGEIVDVLLNKLDEMRGFTESLATFREELGLEETSKRTRRAK
jgi:hypothetical protein